MPIYGWIITGITFIGGGILCIWGYFHAEKMFKEDEERKNNSPYWYW
jgi:hypothetical protein